MPARTGCPGTWPDGGRGVSSGDPVREKPAGVCGFPHGRRQLVGFKACFIATAACGGTDAREVHVLREFRDRVLLRSDLGERMVEAYYRWSPPLARHIQARPGPQAAVRRGLVRPVAHLASALLGRDLIE